MNSCAVCSVGSAHCCSQIALLQGLASCMLRDASQPPPEQPGSKDVSGPHPTLWVRIGILSGCLSDKCTWDGSRSGGVKAFRCLELMRCLPVSPPVFDVSLVPDTLSYMSFLGLHSKMSFCKRNFLPSPLFWYFLPS